MNKTALGVAMVVVFCITWWIVAGEAMQVAQQAEQASQQARQASQQAAQAFTQAKQAFEPARQAERQAYLVFDQARSQSLSTEHPLGRAHLLAQQQAEQAKQQAEQAKAKAEQTEQASQQAAQAFIMADAHWRTQRSWGIAAGLLADLLLLVGALAWSKLTAKA